PATPLHQADACCAVESHAEHALRLIDTDLAQIGAMTSQRRSPRALQECPASARSRAPRITRRRAMDDRAKGPGGALHEADQGAGAPPSERMRRSSTANTGASITTSSIGAAAVHMAAFRPI